MYFKLVMQNGSVVVRHIKQALLQPVWLSVGLACMAAVLVTYIVAPRMLSHGGVLLKLSESIIGANLPVRQVVVHGNNMVAVEDIMQTVARDRPIVLIPLKRLSELVKRSSPWVKSVTVSRVIYSGTLNIGMEEHKAFANWLHEGLNSIIDDTGYVILNSPRRLKNLVSIHGNNAAEHLEFVRDILREEDVLSRMISSFSLLENGTWNVCLSSGLQIKLPGQDPKSAWLHIQRLYGSYEDLLMWKEIDASLPEKGMAVQQ